MDTVIFIVATIVAIISSFYLFGIGQVSHLKKNWVQYRCNPIYMPMAGMVGDDVVSNFTKCTMKGFHDYAGFIMDPLMAEFSIVNDTLGEVTSTMSSMRSMFSGVRGGFLGIVGSVFGKIQNVMSQTQYIVIRMRTLMSRVVGIMFSFVYIFYGGMQSGQSLVNGPVGKTMSFLCFDPDTLVETTKGFKKMSHIEIGDRLLPDLSVVTSTYSLLGIGVHMYSINGVIVTGSHKVKHGNKFIRVDSHPDAKKTDKTCPKLSCINTNNHRIKIKNTEFLDFDESDDLEFKKFKDNYIQKMYNGSVVTKPSPYKNGILPKSEVSLLGGLAIPVYGISVGDRLDNGDLVMGVCIHHVPSNMYVELGKNLFVTPNTWVVVDNKIIPAEKLGNTAIDDRNKTSIVYQLITPSSTIPIVSEDDARFMVLDELQTTEDFYYALKDSIITTGRFRGKEIVI
jgi:hypothetical protein